MRQTLTLFSLLLLGAAATWEVAQAREVAMKREALPPAVLAALNSHYPHAEYLNFTHETTGRTTLYEAEMKVAGHRVDASFESSGKLHEEELQIPVSEIPDPIRTSLAESAQAHWKIEEVERVTTGSASAPARYEILMVHHQARIELVYAADGRRISGARADEQD
jgi:hypothetical protein